MDPGHSQRGPGPQLPPSKQPSHPPPPSDAAVGYQYGAYQAPYNQSHYSRQQPVALHHGYTSSTPYTALSPASSGKVSQTRAERNKVPTVSIE